jgi:hypothetical protein
MAQLINHCVAAGHRIAISIVRFLTRFALQPGGHVRHRKLRQSPLSSLPAEILLHIKDFLPLSSAACLILCNRQMLMALGSQSWYSLLADDQIIERRRFLVALQKDLPDWLLCYPCSLFHPVEPHKVPKNMWIFDKDLPCMQDNGVIFLTASFGIRYQHVQLLMNEHRLGRSYTRNLEALSFNFFRTRHDSDLEGTIWGEIEAGQLLLRFNQRLRLLASGNIKLIHRRLRPICPHLEWGHGDKTLWEAINCRLSHANNLPCAECRMPKCCRECSTWFYAGVRELEDSETEFRIEAWKFLGACETPYDPKWRRQAWPRCKNPIKTSVTAAEWASED